MTRARGRPKTPLDDTKLMLLEGAADAITNWRKAEHAARKAICDAREAGIPARDIAAAVGMPHRTVANWHQAAAEHGIAEPEPAPGPDALRP